MSALSSMAAGKLADYHAAVAQFQAASMGAYSGPSTPFELLQQKIAAVDGLNAQELVAGTTAAVGPTSRGARGRRPRGVGDFFRTMVTNALGSFGGGMLVDHFDKLAADDEEDDEQCSVLVKDSQKCAETIEDICTTSDTAMSEILEPATHLISILTQFLRRTPMGALTSTAIGVAGGLIEDTNEQIVGTCQDRDDSVEKCFEEFLRRCDDVGDRPLPCEPPETSYCPLPAAPAGEHTCEPPPKPVEPCPEETKPVETKPVETKPVDPKPVEPKPAPTKPVESVPAPTPVPVPAPAPEPAACPPPEKIQDSPDCDKPKPQPKPAPQPEPKPVPVEACEPEPTPAEDCVEEPAEPTEPAQPEQPCEPVAESTSCCGVLGAVGVGIAILGLGALMMGISECLEHFGETPEPEPEPEPEQPKPEVTPPPEDLSKVPEPTPPPKKLSAVSGTGDVVVEDSGAHQPQSPPAAPAPSPEPGPNPSSADSAAAPTTTNSPARKAGAW